MTTPILVDHYEVGTDFLPTQYKEKPNIDAMLQTYFDASQVVEQDLFDIMTKTLFLNAEGKNLERYGDLFNIKRGANISDIDYREQLIAEIIRRSSSGSPDNIRQILEATTGMVDTRIYEHVNTRTLTGGVYVFGYSPSFTDAINLNGNEGTYVKRASPVTTGSCVLGLHTKQFVDVNELFIPCEFVINLNDLRVSDAAQTGLDFLVNETIDNIATRGTDNVTFGKGWEQGLLAEYGTAVEAFHVEQTSDEERFLVEAGNGVESFAIELDGIETTHGVMLETAQYSIGDPL